MFGDCYLIVVNSVGMIHCFYCCLLLFNCDALLLVVLLVRVMVLGCFKCGIVWVSGVCCLWFWGGLGLYFCVWF